MRRANRIFASSTEAKRAATASRARPALRGPALERRATTRRSRRPRVQHHPDVAVRREGCAARSSARDAASSDATRSARISRSCGSSSRRRAVAIPSAQYALVLEASSVLRRMISFCFATDASSGPSSWMRLISANILAESSSTLPGSQPNPTKTRRSPRGFLEVLEKTPTPYVPPCCSRRTSVRRLSRMPLSASRRTSSASDQSKGASNTYCTRLTGSSPTRTVSSTLPSGGVTPRSRQVSRVRAGGSPPR